jgi:toxin HigB-1
MIKSFKHKGLEQFFISGSKKGIQPEHSGKLARILDRLDSSINVKDMALAGYKLHKLSGNEKDTWSVWVNGNWRVTFFFEDGDAYLVDYRDYH